MPTIRDHGETRESIYTNVVKYSLIAFSVNVLILVVCFCVPSLPVLAAGHHTGQEFSTEPTRLPPDLPSEHFSGLCPEAMRYQRMIKCMIQRK